MNRIKNLWKEQAMTTHSFSLEDIRSRQAELDRLIYRRNRMEYLTGGLAAAFLLVIGLIALWGADTAADLARAAGFLLLTAGLGIAGIRLFRGSRPGSDGDLAATGREHLLSRLERERRLLASAWLWYVLPLVPGFVLVYLGTWMADPARPAFPLVAGAATFVFLVGVGLVNRAAARRLLREREEMMNELDDQALVDIARARAVEKGVRIDLDDC